MADLSELKKLKNSADKSYGFADKAIDVFKAKGFSESDIEEAKQMIREAWKDKNLKDCWINWIDEEHAKGWR